MSGSMSVLGQMDWSQWGLAVVLIAVCCLLMIVILLQRGRGGGLSGAFGGAGGSSAFGAKTGDVFTWITVVVAGVFVLLAVLANFAFDESAPPVVAPPPAAPPPVQSVIPVRVDDEGNLSQVGGAASVRLKDKPAEAPGGEGAAAEPDGAAGEKAPESENEAKPVTPSTDAPTEATDDSGSKAKPETPGEGEPPAGSSDTP